MYRTTPFAPAASLLAALALVSTLAATPAAAGPIGNSGTRAGVLAGYGSMHFSGGQQTLAAELQRTDNNGNQAFARAVLRDAALHAAAAAHQDQPASCQFQPTTCLTSSAQAQVEIWDILTFRRGDLADPSQVRWRFDISGVEAVGTQYGSTARGSFAYFVGPGAGWSTASAVDVNPGDVFRGSFAMTGETLTIYFYAGLDVSASNGGLADFGNTARFHLELPQGVTFTSRSRNFMADRPPIPAVPEPPALAMGLAGLAMLAWLQRRRSAATAD